MHRGLTAYVSRTLVGLLIALIAFCIGAGSLILPARWSGIEVPPRHLVGLTTLASWRGFARPPAERKRWEALRVIVLGDSMVFSNSPAEVVPLLRGRLIDAYGDRTLVNNLSTQGRSFVDHYFAADWVARAAPEIVVINFNVISLSDRAMRTMAQPAISAAISPSRLPEALAMPLHAGLLSADRLLTHFALMQSGAFEFWYWSATEQARVSLARTALDHALGARFGGAGLASPQKLFDLAVWWARTRQRLLPGVVPQRYQRAGAEPFYGGLVDGLGSDHPMLPFIRGAITRLRRAGIHVIVFGNPINFEHLERIEPEWVPHAAAAMRQVGERVESSGGEWLDLSHLLPDEAFADAQGHFTDGGGEGRGQASELHGEPSGAERVAQALALAVARVYEANAAD